jgi:hypothetical protein
MGRAFSSYKRNSTKRWILMLVYFAHTMMAFQYLLDFLFNIETFWLAVINISPNSGNAYENPPHNFLHCRFSLAFMRKIRQSWAAIFLISGSHMVFCMYFLIIITCFLFQKLSPTEMRYFTFDREPLVALSAGKHFRFFI